jgi:RNA polymerase sigma factor (sigma-70 family)
MDGRLLEKYLPMIEAYFLARAPAPEDAEDLAQEAAYQVVRSYGRFQHRSALGTWVYAVCRNVYSSHLRAAMRSRGRTGGRELDPADPADEVLRRDIAISLGSLGARDRLLYDLYYCRGYSVREIAVRLAKPEGTIKYELHMLRRRAEEVLE